MRKYVEYTLRHPWATITWKCDLLIFPLYVRTAIPLLPLIALLEIKLTVFMILRQPTKP